MLLDTYFASIAFKDANDNIIPLALKGRLKNDVKPLKSNDKNSSPTLKHFFKNKLLSNKDLTIIKSKTIQRKLMSKVKYIYY